MLDVGCGTGQLCKPFASIFNRIYGIDVSESQLNIAKEKNKDFENVQFKSLFEEIIYIFCFIG